MKCFTHICVLLLSSLSFGRTQFQVPFLEYNVTGHKGDNTRPLSISVSFPFLDPHLGQTTQCRGFMNLTESEGTGPVTCEDGSVFKVRTHAPSDCNSKMVLAISLWSSTYNL